MNTLSKVLAVLVVATSLAFMGFVIVMLAGGPNWGAERLALEDHGYSFTKSEGEVVQWSAKFGSGDDVQTVGSSTPIEPEAIISARKHLDSQQKQEINRLQTENPILEADTKTLKDLVQVDMKAIDNRRASKQQAVEDLREEHVQVATDVKQKAIEGTETQERVKARRRDVYRVREQIEEIEADTARIVDERDLLQIRLTILEGINERLASRRKRMENRLGGDNDAPPTATGSETGATDDAAPVPDGAAEGDDENTPEGAAVPDDGNAAPTVD